MTCIKTAKKPSYLNTSIPEIGKRAAKTENPSDLDRFSRMQDELEALRNEITKKNRDQLDMMYNLDMDNFSDDTKALFKKWSDGANDAKTYFQTYINSNEAKWQAYSEWKTATSTSISTIEGRVTANESSINILSQWKSSATNSIAAIQQKADANASQINILSQWKTDTADGAISSIAAIQQQADANGARIGLLVNSSGTGLVPSAAGIIVSAVNGSGSSVMIKANKIQFDGEASFVTAGSLGDSGSTVVSGNRIKLHMLYNTGASTSELGFTASQYADDSWKDDLGYIRLDDSGSGSATSSRYSLMIKTISQARSMGSGTEGLPVAIKLISSGSISIESNTQDGGIYIDALGYFTLKAYENVRIRAQASMANMGQTGLMAFSDKDYIFCTDGIYYNGKRIVDNTKEV